MSISGSPHVWFSVGFGHFMFITLPLLRRLCGSSNQEHADTRSQNHSLRSVCSTTMGHAPHLAYQEMVAGLSGVHQGSCLQKVRYRLLQASLAEAVLPGACPLQSPPQRPLWASLEY